MMKHDTQKHDTQPSVRRCLTGMLLPLVLLAWAAIGVQVHAQCNMGFLSSATAITVDGNNAGAEWSDAQTSILTSSNPCFEELLDDGGASNNVTVYTKRYASGGDFLGFFFEVLDGSTSGPGAGGLLLNGERIVLHFDPNRSGGTGLENGGAALDKDYQIVITHKWESSAGDPDLVDNVMVEAFDASATSAICNASCGDPATWQGIAAPATLAAVVRKDFPGGYTVEVAVPLSMIGNPAGDIGVAVAVINDFGTGCAGSTCDSAGAAFPSSLPISNADNPVNGCGCSWKQPANWGTGYFTTPPTDVTISRMPIWWNSEAIEAFDCSATPTYTYYPGNPCKLTLEATLDNAGATTQRNLLFVFADHGASPFVWRVIDLLENVSVPGGSSVVSSNQWDGVPTGLANHPCVRVYILPPTFVASFDKADILAIANQTDLDNMVAAYGIATPQWAQKNISAAGGGSNCPDVACRVAALGLPLPGRLAETGRAPTTPDEARVPAMLVSGASPPPAAGTGALFALVAVAGLFMLGGMLWAKRRGHPRYRLRWVFAVGVLLVAVAVSCQTTLRPIDPKPMNESDQGRKVFLSDAEIKQFARDHVVVQAKALGFSPVQVRDRPTYNFIENLGGVVQLFAEKIVQEQGQVAVTFNVTNLGRLPRTIAVQIDTQTPAALKERGGVRVNLDFERTQFRPGETRRVQGVLVLQKGRDDG